MDSQTLTLFADLTSRTEALEQRVAALEKEVRDLRSSGSVAAPAPRQHQPAPRPAAKTEAAPAPKAKSRAKSKEPPPPAAPAPTATQKAKAEQAPKAVPSPEMDPKDVAERNALLVALMKNGWDRSAAARDLGVVRRTVYRRMEAYGITPPAIDGRHSAKTRAANKLS